MKKTLYLLLSTAVLAALASCKKEVEVSVDPVSVSIDISIGVRTRSDLDNASGSFKLYIAVFNAADGSLMPCSCIGGTGFEDAKSISAASAENISLRLLKDYSYKVVLFAQKEDAYTVSFANNNVATFSYKSGLKANDANLDAFWGVLDVDTGNNSYSVSLKRPFAQLNVLVPVDAVPSSQSSFASSMTVKAPASFDLFAGEATGEFTNIEFSQNTISATPDGQYAGTHKWIGMNYVLVPASGTVDVISFMESGMADAFSKDSVPVKMNGRTNIVGDLYEGGSVILTYDAPGAYLNVQERSYVAGTDQYCVEIDGTALSFVLLNPAYEEQLVISGYDTGTHVAGDSITITIDWMWLGSLIYQTSLTMAVKKIQGSQVWLESSDGQGVIIRTE